MPIPWEELNVNHYYYFNNSMQFHFFSFLISVSMQVKDTNNGNLFKGGTFECSYTITDGDLYLCLSGQVIEAQVLRNFESQFAKQLQLLLNIFYYLASGDS